MQRRNFLSGAAAACAIGPRLFAAETPLRVAVIGHTGRGNYGHEIDTLWRRLPETTLVAVADADEKGLAAALNRLKVSAGFSDYRKMLAEVRPDIAAIGPRWIGQHHDMAMAAIASGVRGIYMEKPFCRTLAEADAVIAACERKNIKLALAHRNRYDPAVEIVKKMIVDGAIGRLLEARGRGKEDDRGGVLDLWVLGSHIFNMAHCLLGTPTACSATLLLGGRPVAKSDLSEGAEEVGPVGGDELHARFEMESGVSLFFESVRKAGSKTAGFGLQLIGTQGMIDIHFDVSPIAHLVPGNPFTPTKEARPWIPISSAGPGKPEPIPDCAMNVKGHVFSARDLIAAMRENRQPVCSAADGRVSLEMIMAVFESHRQGGRRTGIPLQNRLNPLDQLTEPPALEGIGYRQKPVHLVP